jgi:hypothetical protein
MSKVEAPPISSLVAQLLEANMTQTHAVTNAVIDNLTRNRDEANATLAAIRAGVFRLLSGPYMPTSEAIREALWPSADMVNAHRKAEEVPW